MKFVALFMVFFSLSFPVFAMSPVNPDTINEAINYGTSNAKLSFDQFSFSWLAYEENVQQLNEMAERANVYTPFLLVASNARQNYLGNRTVNFEDSKKFLADYDGYLVFSVNLFGKRPDFLGTATAFIKQGTKIVKAYQYSIPPETEKTAWYPQQPEFSAQIYCYFPEKSIATDIPLTLVIATADKKLHKFYFDLAKVK